MMMIARLGTLLSVLLIICPLWGSPVYAQENSATLDGYVPPPMFGVQRPVPPKKAQPKVPSMPAISKPATPEPVKEQRKAVKPKPKPKSAPLKKAEPKKKTSTSTKKTTKPQAKPVKLPPIVALETIEAAPVETPPRKAEPTDLFHKKAPPAPKPPKTKKSSDFSAGVVKGPKTMPAVKKQNVESEILFVPKAKPTVNLIDRVQKEEKTKTVKETLPVEAHPPKNYTAPKFSVLPNGSRKLNLIFREIQAELSEGQKYTLNQLIIPRLKENTKTRLRLEAYASPRDGSLSGDRRIALSRAMAIRKHIIDQNIAPNRLDVRSLGAQTDVIPMDRVEIFLNTQ